MKLNPFNYWRDQAEDNTVNLIQERLLTSLSSYQKQVDYLEIRLQQSESTAISYRGVQLDAVNRSFSLSGGIRACHKGGWSFVTFNNLDELNHRIEEAISQAHLIGEATTELAEISPIQDYVSVELKRDARGISVQEKRELVANYNQ